MRITITEEEYEKLKYIADFSLIDGSEIEFLNTIIDKIEVEKKKEASKKIG